MINDLVVNIKDADLFLGGKQILFNVNWRVRHGEHWFILGPNGAGKTTLTRMILVYIWPKYGSEISILGNTYGKCDLFHVRKKIAWISPYLLKWTSNSKWTVQDVVISGVDSTVGLYRKATDDEIEKTKKFLTALDALKLERKSFLDLSSGEQVKVLIARALMSEAKIMILDEACVHLDLKSREHLLDMLKNLTQSKESPSIIFVTQRIEDIIPEFNKGMMLKNGKVLAIGNRDDILKVNNIENLFEMNVELVKTKRNRYWPIVK
ncbi:MAG TPA: ATP-binding cassette domain-containing protein [Victivallales bacterium]|nr:ATP-binding cassette domain-containing protein [Victivallales bacterium]